MTKFAASSGVWIWLLACSIASDAIGQESLSANISKPLSPAEALTKFVLAEPDLKIELAAAEPEVIDPVAIRFDEKGRMWVAEMGDYPLGPPAGEAPLSRIKVLEDRDADGRFETATLFADKLSFVTGLQPWRGGVIVTLAGRIAWMKDTNDDGRMDVDETWYTGFAEQNSQLRANHPRLALDNHVYVANGLKGGMVVNKRLPDEKPISLQGRDFRFDPLTGKAESVSGNGQFGMCFDDWGNRFTCTNRNPVIHVVLEDRYLKLAPKIPVAAVTQDVAAFGEQSKVYPISRAWTTSNLHAGTFTAACGVHIYRGDILRRVLGDNSVFTCDPTGNFIHREIMEPDGPSFKSKPAYAGKEFLASTDEWFRPVSIELGPDGCLYIVDMYRCVIEHPDFVPDELKKRPDLRLGDDKGRIWRIAPKNGLDSERRKLAIKLPLHPGDVVPKLDHSSAWQRETVQRCLLELRQPNDSRPLNLPAIHGVKRLMAKTELPQTRVHLQWLLYAHSPTDDFAVRENLRAEEPQVRRQAMLLAEIVLQERKDELNNFVRPLHIIAPEVRFQKLLLELALLGEQRNAEVNPQLLPQEVSQSRNRWLHTALTLRHHQSLLALFEAVASHTIDQPALKQDLARLIGNQGTEADVDSLAQPLLSRHEGLSEAERVILLDEFAKGLSSRGMKLADAIAKVDRVYNKGRTKTLLTDQCIDLIRNDRQTEAARAAAARLLGHLPGVFVQRALLREPLECSVDVRVALVSSLAQQSDAKSIWRSMLTEYESHSLPIKRALIDNSFRRSDGPSLLLEQVKAGVIQSAEIDPLKRKQLLESKDAAIKKLAEELFAALNPANRQQALEEYQPVLKLKADAIKGKVVFEKNCSNCHKVGDVGVNVAPDISDTRTKTAGQLLADIIQPNRAIDNNYIGYQVALKDGTVTTGILTAETSTSLTLKQPGGKVLTVARDEVEQLKASGVSLMPDGLEKNIPPEAMADLLAYLKGWRYLDGKTPLGPVQGASP